MKNISLKTCKSVRLIYGWVFSAYTFTVAALFIWQVLDIYFGGKAQGLSSVYSYELVAERIGAVIAVPFWIWIATAIIGFVLWELFPVPEKLPPVTSATYIAKRMQKRLPAEVGADLKESFEYVNNERKLLNILRYSLWGIVAAYLIFVVIYMSIPTNFPNENATHEVLNAFIWFLPFGALVYAAGCAYVIILNNSYKKQLPHLKKLTAGRAACPTVVQSKLREFLNSKYFILGLRIAVACVGIAFVIAGCFNGSVGELFYKAINICTECIGLG